MLNLNVIPLQFAALCLNDESIFDLRVGECPVCARKDFLSMSRVLNRKAGANEADLGIHSGAMAESI